MPNKHLPFGTAKELFDSETRMAIYICQVDHGYATEA